MHHGFAVFTTRWGARFGGINTFNVDLCTALAETAPVWCIVLIATDDESEAAGRVSLLSLTSEATELDVAMADRALALLAATGAKPRWFIGHDTVSGGIALTAAGKANARCAVFHHMAPGIYKSIEGYSPEQVATKRAYQRDILRRADQVFAVGPSLLKSASDHLAEDQFARSLFDEISREDMASWIGRLRAMSVPEAVGYVRDMFRQARAAAGATEPVRASAPTALGLDVSESCVSVMVSPL